jgi:lipopolysaccharide assembly protein A
MKFLGRIIFLPVAVAVVLFAIANRNLVAIDFWPLPFGAETPLYVALLGALALGILIGAAASSVSVGKWRFRARANARRNAVSANRPKPGADQGFRASAGARTPPAALTDARTTALPTVRRAALDDD